MFDSRGNVLTPNEVNHKRKQSIVAHSRRVRTTSAQHRTLVHGKMQSNTNNTSGQKPDRDGDLIVRYRYKPDPGYVGQDSFSFRQPNQYSLLSAEAEENENGLSRITRRRGKEVVVLVTVTQTEPTGDERDLSEGNDPYMSNLHGLHSAPSPQQIHRENNSNSSGANQLVAGLASCQYILQVVVLQARGVITYPG